MVDAADIQRVHVMAAVIVGLDQRIFVAKRPEHKHQGGLWEFPGGKLEPGEEPHLGLARELEEELGICVTQCEPLMTISHDYADKSVFLDVWRVDGFKGEPHGREGQLTQWVTLDELPQLSFPAANQAIIDHLLQIDV